MEKNKKERVLKGNILGILETELNRTGEGIIQERLVGLAYSGNDFDASIYGLLQELEKNKLIEKSIFPGSGQMLITLTPLGRKELKKFKKGMSSEEERLFLKNIPLSYHTSVKINFIEKFLGFFSLSLLILALWILVISVLYSQNKEVSFLNFINTFFSSGVSNSYSFLIITIFSLIVLYYTYFLTLEMINVGVGKVIGKMFFNLGDIISKNQRLSARVIFFVTVGILIWFMYALSPQAAVIAIISLVLGGLIGNYRKVEKGIVGLFNKNNRKR